MNLADLIQCLTGHPPPFQTPVTEAAPPIQALAQPDGYSTAGSPLWVMEVFPAQSPHLAMLCRCDGCEIELPGFEIVFASGEQTETGDPTYDRVRRYTFLDEALQGWDLLLRTGDLGLVQRQMHGGMAK